jgi:hypothetical protein
VPLVLMQSRGEEAAWQLNKTSEKITKTEFSWKLYQTGLARPDVKNGRRQAPTITTR